MSEIDLDSLKTRAFESKLDPLGKLTHAIAALGTIWTFGLMLLIVADVVGRSFLSRPITGVAEIAAHSIVAIVFLQLASTVHAKRMTRADFLIERFRASMPALARVLEVIFATVGAFICLLIAYACWKPLVGAYLAGEYFGVRGVFTIATWPFRALIVAGSALAGIVFCVQSVQFLTRRSGEGV